MEFRVIAYSGHTCPSEPLEFYIGDERHEVHHILRSYLEETPGLEGMTRKVWLVTDRRGKRYRLTYYCSTDLWDVQPDETGRPA